MSARKKPSKEEPLTEEEREKLKSLLERLKEPAMGDAEQAEKEGEAPTEEEGEAESLTEEEIEKLNKLFGPPNWEQAQLFRKAGRTIAKKAAIAQIIDTMPEGTDVYQANATGALPFLSFLPSDGTELSLSRLSVAATNAAMDCFARAANTEEITVRELELNSATKLSLATAALCRALDHHRGPDRPEYIDDTVPRRRPLTTADIVRRAQTDSKDSAEKGGGEATPKDDRETTPKDETPSKEEEPNSSSA